MAHGKIPRFLRTALQISLLCTISVSQVFARSRTLVGFSVGNNKLARDQVSDCDLYSTLCIPKRQYLYKAQVGPRELPLRGRGSVKFREPSKILFPDCRCNHPYCTVRTLVFVSAMSPCSSDQAPILCTTLHLNSSCHLHTDHESHHFLAVPAAFTFCTGRDS